MPAGWKRWLPSLGLLGPPVNRAVKSGSRWAFLGLV
jgi:hypothetical protein